MSIQSDERGRREFRDGRAVRLAARAGVWQQPTAGLAPGYVQGNLAILPAALAHDFLRFGGAANCWPNSATFTTTGERIW